MKALILLITATVIAISSTVFADEPVQGGTLNSVIQPEPPGLMLGLVQNGPTQMVAGQIYESLLRYDHDLNPMPSLAKEWSKSKDGLTYTFTLQNDVLWHDGVPFTSADVVFSVDEFLRETHPRLRASLVYVDKITAPNDKTVVFQLKQPFGPFLGMFETGTMPIIPKHIYDGTDYTSNPMNNTPIGTGPFKFSKWERGSYIHLVRNEDYYVDGKPHLDEIYYQVIPDAASRAIAFETGKVDLLPGGSVENFDIPRLIAMDNVCSTNAGWEFFGPHSWMWLNMHEGPMTDKNLRKAVMHAMDREFARDALWNGNGDLAKGPISSVTRFHEADTPDITFNPDKARKYLAASEYDGRTLRLLPLPYGETWQRWAEATRQNLSDIGINVEIMATDVAGWNQKVANWDFDMAFTYLYQYGDPALGVARTFISSNIAKGSPWNNVSGYINEEVDALFAEAAIQADDTKRQELYTRAQNVIVDDVPVAWMLELKFPTIYRCNLKNPVSTAIGVNDGLRDAWLAKK